jgi:sulfoxide reductase heme-binding subunit YedZ
LNAFSFPKLVLLVNGLVPATLIVWDAAHGNLGANPIEFVLRSSGFLALVFLVLTLAVTPLRKATGWHSLAKLRRMLGLFSFFYALAHVSLYLVLDQSLQLGAIATDLLSRPFIFLGALAFGFMVPLAVTSTNGWIKRLGGPRWRQLHKRVYFVAVCAAAHYFLAVKADVLKPILFGGALVLLLLLRWLAPSERRSLDLRPPVR